MSAKVRRAGVVGILTLGCVFLGPLGADAQEKERTPSSLLSAIEQRNQELDKRLKAASLKEQRLRILEQEINQKLDDIKKVRNQMKAKEEAEKKAKALDEAKKAKVLAEKAKALEKEKKGKEAEEEKSKAIQKAVEEETAKLRKATENEMKEKAESAQGLKGEKKEKMKVAAKEKMKVAAEERLARAKAAAKKRKAQAEARAAKKKEKVEEATPDLPLEKMENLAVIKKEEAARKAMEEKRFKDLARVYEKMPPAEAALRLQNMHEITALEIIPRMNKAKLARVLSSMDPVVAVRYTERIGMGGPFFPTDTPPLNPPPPGASPRN